MKPGTDVGGEEHLVKNFLFSIILMTAALASASPCTAKITGIEKTDDGLIAHSGASVLQLQVWSDRIVRVRYAAAGKLTDPVISAVIAKPAATKFELIDSTKFVGIKTASVETNIDRETGTVSFVDPATGKAFLSEAADGRSTTTTQVGDQTIHGPAQTFIRQDGEAIIGLGQHQEGQFNYIDTTVRLLQQNTEIGVPVLTSSAGYTLLWDNPAVTDIDTGNPPTRATPAHLRGRFICRLAAGSISGPANG
jgi:alpha-D-xyloside xylohydrolase